MIYIHIFDKAVAKIEPEHPEHLSPTNPKLETQRVRGGALNPKP